MSKAYLVLENGRVFEGESFGAKSEIMGEVVFTTGMSGYLETLTDKSSLGEIVVQTFPMMGNYGVIPEDFESKGCSLKGYIVREICDKPSNFRCQGTLTEFLTQSGVVGICGVDTRALTRAVREHGVMNGKIVYEKPDVDKIVSELKGYQAKITLSDVSAENEVFTSPFAKYKVALFDFGGKDSIRKELVKRDCEVHVFNVNSTVEEILSVNPDGIVLSNGPGNPKEYTELIEKVKALMDAKKPMMGICLGHILMALSQGADCHKLKYGHRGENQPVLDTATDKIYITCQNHGYAVTSKTLPENASVSYLNANDKTCEGVQYSDRPAFSVQFHPEAAAGPLDTLFLFDKFISLIKEANSNAVK